MSQDDRRSWDERYAGMGMAAVRELESNPPPPDFADVEHLFGVEGRALDVACGRGRGAVWLARRGMEVWGVDVSRVAIDLARRLAEAFDVSHRCHLWVHDLDEGLPPGPAVDVILCDRFRDERLDRQMVERLAPSGLLAVVALSEVDAGPGPFRVRPGELRHAFAGLEILDEREQDGIARLVGRNPGPAA